MLRVVDHSAATDVGRVRRANEDSHFVRVPLFVVADGMGGANAGEVASGIAVDVFKQPLDESLAPEPRMAAAVLRANHEIYAKSISDEQFNGMGTTITALLLGESELTIAHVGDSRAYRLRGGELTRLTRDHSLVGEMVRRGAITEAEAEVHPQRSILTRALGPEDDVEVDTLSHGVQGGDVYLICSDGLTGMVDEATIAEQMGAGTPMKEVAEELIRRANENGGVDNITAVAFRVEGQAPAGASEPENEATAAHTVVTAAPAVEPAQQAEPAAATTQAEPATATRAPQPQTAAAGATPVTTTAEYDRRRAASRKQRRWVGGLIISGVILIAVAGAIVASLNIYFIGGNEKGLVTVYRGLPYELPLSVNLYTRDYVTSVPVSELPPALRQSILDHKLRSRRDALDLARQIELGEIDPVSVEGRKALERDQPTGGASGP